MLQLMITKDRGGGMGTIRSMTTSGVQLYGYLTDRAPALRHGGSGSVDYEGAVSISLMKRLPRLLTTRTSLDLSKHSLSRLDN